MRRLIPAAFAVALLVSGCGSSTAGLDSVKVTGGKTPTVTVGKNFKATKTTTKILKKGSGHKVVDGDAVTLDYVAVNGRTGKTFDSSFKSGSPLTTTIKSGSVLAGFVKGIVGKTVGSRVLIAIPPKDGFGAANTQLGLKATDTMVFLMDIVKADSVPEAASGKSQKLPDTLPKLVLDKAKHPSKFTKTSTTEATHKKMSASVAIEGSGPVVKAGQSITIQYVGEVYPDGKIFDESWSSAARTFQIGNGQLIKCWDDSLVGQKVGSRLVLVCPSDVAYGKAGRAPDIKGGDTLIFAVDLLAAF
ncbi:MAG: FKBP-type peptidyl-prolyl cis-trans isomerase [Aeromicrobium sp.]